MVQQPCGKTPKRPQYLVEKSFPQQNGEKVENLFTKKFAGKRKKCLTERHTMRYTVELQACPQSGTDQDPIPGISFYGGYNHEENFSAQEASAQGSSWLSDPHEHQERPQGHQCSPCKGPQEPDRLIQLRWAMGPAQNWTCAQKAADIELAVFFFIFARFD